MALLLVEMLQLSQKREQIDEGLALSGSQQSYRESPSHGNNVVQ
jgi:hypothetical protein